MNITIKNVKEKDFESITNKILDVIGKEDIGTLYILKTYDLDRNFKGVTISIE